MFKKIFRTSNDVSPTVLRVVLGIVIFAHGAQKLFGIWGGHGPKWTVEAWNQWWNMPALLTYAVIGIESVGAVLLVLGLCTRIWAALIGFVMFGAVYLVHVGWGFYMNWYMQPQTGEGFEYHLLVMSMVVVLIIKGGGKMSLDEWIYKKMTK